MKLTKEELESYNLYRRSKDSGCQDVDSVSITTKPGVISRDQVLVELYKFQEAIDKGHFKVVENID